MTGICNHTWEKVEWEQSLANWVLNSCSVVSGAMLKVPGARIGTEGIDAMNTGAVHFGMAHVNNENLMGTTVDWRTEPLPHASGLH